MTNPTRPPEFLDGVLDALEVAARGFTDQELFAQFGTTHRARLLSWILALKAEKASGLDLGGSPSRYVN
jgi:hypothetical protein